MPRHTQLLYNVLYSIITTATAQMTPVNASRSEYAKCYKLYITPTLTRAKLDSRPLIPHQENALYMST